MTPSTPPLQIMAREVLAAELKLAGFADCEGHSQRDYASIRAMIAFADLRLEEAAKVASEHQRHVPRRDIIANGYSGNVVDAILSLRTGDQT